MISTSKNERLLNLVSFLLKARQPVSLTHIRTSVNGYDDPEAAAGVVERRFERDKAALRELGVPLKYVGDEEAGPEGPGYLIARDAYFLPHVQLTPAEAALLAGAGQFALAGAAGPVSEAITSAIRKLQFDSPIPGDIRETAEERLLFHRRAAGADSQEQRNLEELTAALLNRRAVSFAYYGIGADRVQRRQVEPYGIGFSDGHWYLVGHDRGRGEIRIFRTDRIRKGIKRLHLDSTRPEFDVPGDFRVQDYVGVPPWLFGKARRIMVKIRFDETVAFMVRMHPAPDDRWTTQGDAAILTRQATHLAALLHWVLGFGHHAQVLEPPEFRAQVIKALRATARLHAEGGPV